jgi:hypothetical protein
MDEPDVAAKLGVAPARHIVSEAERLVLQELPAAFEASLTSGRRFLVVDCLIYQQGKADGEKTC